MRLCSSGGGTNTSVTSGWPSDSACALLGASEELVQDVSHPGLGSPWHSSSALPTHFPFYSASRAPRGRVSIRAEERFERCGHVTVHTTLETPAAPCSSPHPWSEQLIPWADAAPGTGIYLSGVPKQEVKGTGVPCPLRGACGRPDSFRGSIWEGCRRVLCAF